LNVIATGDGGEGVEEAAEAVEAAAEATEAAAQAAEAAAEAAEAAAEAGEGGEGGEGGATDREVEEAERLAVLEWGHALHDGEAGRHLTREEAESIARSVMWQEAEQLAQYAADLAAQQAPEPDDVTVVQPDVPEGEGRKGGVLGRIF
jgi:hypothetical protein